MTLDNMTGITKGSYTGFCKSQLITCNRVKECNGVCPFEDALKHADKMQIRNEQHIIDHDRDWIIGCIKHDGFIKTDRFDKANEIILEALSADAETKCIAQIKVDTEEVVRRIKEEYDITDGWIPCSERLPKRDELVLVTYKTTDRIHLCRYLDDGSENPWWSYIDDCCAWNNVVLAWMPLPKPYRKDGEDDGED